MSTTKCILQNAKHYNPKKVHIKIMGPFPLGSCVSVQDAGTIDIVISYTYREVKAVLLLLLFNIFHFDLFLGIVISDI